MYVEETKIVFILILLQHIPIRGIKIKIKEVYKYNTFVGNEISLHKMEVWHLYFGFVKVCYIFILAWRWRIKGKTLPN